MQFRKNGYSTQTKCSGQSLLSAEVPQDVATTQIAQFSSNHFTIFRKSSRTTTKFKTKKSVIHYIVCFQMLDVERWGSWGAFSLWEGGWAGEWWALPGLWVGGMFPTTGREVWGGERRGGGREEDRAFREGLGRKRRKALEETNNWEAWADGRQDGVVKSMRLRKRRRRRWGEGGDQDAPTAPYHTTAPLIRFALGIGLDNQQWHLFLLT